MLFFANVLEFNGGSTFLLRICKALFLNGHKPGVLVLFKKVDDEILLTLSQYANVYFLDDYLHFPFRYFPGMPLHTLFPFKFSKINEIVKQHNGNVHVMGLWGLFLANRLLKANEESLFLSVGIYHQNEFVFHSRKYYFLARMLSFFCRLPDKSFIFYNEHCVKSYSSYFNRDFREFNLLPVGIDSITLEPSKINFLHLKKIVSVGNLEKFKTYNRYIIEILPELLKKRPDIEYHIYGTGGNEAFLKGIVKKLGLDDKVFFHGQVPYHDLKHVLVEALVFVGSGTALVEAASMGIPSLVGVESLEKAYTYGFLYETQGYTYHEYDPDKKMTSFKDNIESVINDEVNWYSCSEKCKVRASDFLVGKTLNGFSSLINNPELKVDSLLYEKYSIFVMFMSILRCVLDSILFDDKRFRERRNQGTIFKQSNERKLS